MALPTMEFYYNSCPTQIRHTFSLKSYGSGELIIEQGKMNGNVFILTKGNAKVYYMTGIGTPFIEYIYGPWELFGEVEAFNNRAPVCSIEAINDCSVTAVGYDSFIKWLSLDFSFNLFIH